MRNVCLFSLDSEHTTAKYFERAIRSDCDATISHAESVLDLGTLSIDDIFLFVDHAPKNWPTKFEQTQSVTVAYLVDVHQGLQPRLLYAPFFDAVFIAQKDYLQTFERRGAANVHWLPLALDPEIHQIHGVVRDLDVAFVGQLGSRGSNRNKVLTAVLPNFKTNDYELFYPPKEMARVYARSKVVLNASINGDLNMRFFEGLASGALVVTDRIQNGLQDLFIENCHYVGYSSIEEAKEKITYYLAHPAERERIGRAGQQEALRNHTYRHRWEVIRKIASADLSDKSAEIRSMNSRECAQAYSRIFERLGLPSQVWHLAYANGPRRLALLAPFIIRAFARKINSRVRLSPGAIAARFGFS
jgi:hypothetical protein